MTAQLPNFMDKFKLNLDYQLIIYISAVIFFLSLFIPTQGIENNIVQTKSLIILVMGLVTWCLLKIFAAIYDYQHMTSTYKDEQLAIAKGYGIAMFVVRIGYLILTIMTLR